MSGVEDASGNASESSGPGDPRLTEEFLRAHNMVEVENAAERDDDSEDEGASDAAAAAAEAADGVAALSITAEDGSTAGAGGGDDGGASHLADPVGLASQIKEMDTFAMEEFQRIALAEEGSGEHDWSEIESPDAEALGISVSVRQSANEQVRCFRGIGKVEAPASEIFSLVTTKDMDLKRKFDKMIKSMKTIKRIDEHTEILRFAYRTPSILIRQRDFVFIRVCKKLENGSYISVSRSVVHPDAPPKKGYKRGEIILSGWLLVPSEDGRSTMCHSIDQFNPHGKVAAIFEMQVIHSKPLTIQKLREYVAKH
jgi:hypothetical protein|eukprot:TRINITY_DN13139_c0_g1_i1.p1 TRINITY_DN13139_c0_g1~~TRINITY_DN13139_c0_g1_i1.p1  ORF type:complete len:312 (+),score=145.86 TRINITY_DN13139_c0_g1_i1:1027-1962(+)